MTQPAVASHPRDAVAAYVATLFAALGDRDPQEVLRATPAELRQAVAGLSPDQLSRLEAPGKWSIRQVVLHLADSELVGGFRYRMVLAHDRPTLPGYDQDLWADRLRYQEADLEAALDDFATLRRSNLRLLAGLSDTDRARAMQHEERGEESIARMMTQYAGHDRVHLNQIERIKRAIG
jgi:hypothetical protein